MRTFPTLDVIVPCFNPRSGWEHNLADSVERLRTALPNGVLQSIILVDDGSTQGVTDQGLEQLQVHVPELAVMAYTENRGKGHAVRTGVGVATADIMLYTDVDFPYPERSMAEFYRVLADGEAEVVVATRGETYYRALSPFRKSLSKALRWWNGYLFSLKVTDTQGGLKGFDRKGKEVFLTTKVERYLFDLEFIRNASKKGLRICPVDVQLKPDVVLPEPGWDVLFSELKNFAQLLFR